MRRFITGTAAVVLTLTTTASAATGWERATAPEPGNWTVVAGPVAVLDVPDEQVSSRTIERVIVADDSRPAPGFPIVEQVLAVRSPGGSLTVSSLGPPGPDARTDLMMSLTGTWTMTLTVTDIVGRSHHVTETIEVRPNLAEQPPTSP